jgi:hypothetical protein
VQGRAEDRLPPPATLGKSHPRPTGKRGTLQALTPSSVACGSSDTLVGITYNMRNL